jgi:hypothetical protein
MTDRGLRAPLLGSILHNIGVLTVGFVVAFIGTRIDGLLNLRGFASPQASVLGGVLLAPGFLLRVWTTFHFYRKRCSATLGRIARSGWLSGRRPEPRHQFIDALLRPAVHQA